MLVASQSTFALFSLHSDTCSRDQGRSTLISVLSDGGVGGRQRVWVTKKDPSTCVSSDGGGWWQAESVSDKKEPFAHVSSDGGGLMAGRECGLTKKDPSARVLSDGGGQGWLTGRKTPPSCVSSEGGDEGLVGGQTVSSILHFERGRGAGVSTLRLTFRVREGMVV